ncbi:somatostatin receptor type 5 [Nematostella vectensis]|uniref:somatostatin receptor type 5 n=1 Tax=Nematostella vectensis TaxID=45351 RepID=UPI00139036D0|nr:somatostatin receptor type 5 [Nematostella vectensis]XP_032233109.1 somatostatin receptor type 5 [Nematostella vectensis]
MAVTGLLNISLLVNYTNSSDYTPNAALSPELEPKVLEIFRLCLSALICSTGIVGNILVVIITTCNRKTRTAVNYYILNLAISDLGILAICFPFILVKTEDPLHWPLGGFVCKVIYPLSDIFYGVSIGSIVAIAIDRYKAIVRSMRAQKTLQAAKWVILFIWVFAFVGFVLPLYFVMDFLVDANGPGTVDCTPTWPMPEVTMRLYVFSLTFFWYVLPLAVIVWVYRKIAQKIRASRALHKTMRSQVGRKYSEIGKEKSKAARRKHDDSNAKALKILIPVVCVFSLTMFPFHLFRCTQMIVDMSSFEYMWAIYNVCTVCLLANSSANPIIYSMVSDEFRRRFRQLLCLQWNKFNDSLSVRRSHRAPSTSAHRLTSQTQRSFHKNS